MRYMCGSVQTRMLFHNILSDKEITKQDRGQCELKVVLTLRRLFTLTSSFNSSCRLFRPNLRTK